MSDSLLTVRQPKPEFVYVIGEHEIISEVIEDFHEDLPGHNLIVSGCMYCDRMIVTCWPSDELPPVLTLACPDCLKGLSEANRKLTESN